MKGHHFQALTTRELAIALPIAMSFQPYAYNIRRSPPGEPIRMIELTPSPADLLFAQWLRW